MGPWFVKVSPTFSITTSCLSEVCFRVEYDNIGLHHPPIFRLPFEKNARTSDQIHSCYTYGKRKICFSEKNNYIYFYLFIFLKESSYREAIEILHEAVKKADINEVIDILKRMNNEEVHSSNSSSSKFKSQYFIFFLIIFLTFYNPWTIVTHFLTAAIKLEMVLNKSV
jgi:hypothetical protein